MSLVDALPYLLAAAFFLPPIAILAAALFECDRHQKDRERDETELNGPQ